MRRLTLLLFVLALIAGACNGAGEVAGTTTSSSPVTAAPASTEPSPTATTSAPTSTSPPTTSPPEPATALPAAAAFAAFSGVPLLAGPAYTGPPAPADLSDVLVAPLIDSELAGTDASGALVDNSFVVVPSDQLRLFHQAYDVAVYDVYPVYVTTDVGYHVWHLVFSRALREIEEQTMLPVLDRFLANGLDGARRQADDLAGTALADDSVRVVEWFQVAGALAGHDVGELSARAQSELDLATTAVEFTNSPITSFDDTASPLVGTAGLVDYSQMRPRGHYTRSDALQRYFKAMAFMGQSGFFADQPQSLRLGLLAARIVVSDPGLSADWTSLYEATSFLVGTSDDYTPLEAERAAAEEGLDLVDVAAFSDDGAVMDVAVRLRADRPVLINPEGASMRMMGARFVVDSFVLDQLTWPSVGTETARRVTPSGLDVAATFGSNLARQLQIDAGQDEYANYLTQLDAVSALVAGRPVDQWAGTVYDAWLYALQPMWQEHGDAFPEYMQSPQWAAKDLQTGLGSYTELKHDTILYAKQGFAAEGGGEPEPFLPRHWVEPDPVAFERLAAAGRLIRDGLADRELLASEEAALLDLLIGFEERLGRIARDELAGVSISNEDNEWLRYIGGDIEAIWLASADIDPSTGLPEPGDQDAALIADIFSSTFKHLELGTGRIDLIYVLVPNDEGRFQIARGGVYSFYEFTQPVASGRLTDEEWRTLLSTDPPLRPAWQSPLFGAGSGSAALPETFDGLPTGMFCRDLYALGRPYSVAHEYWVWDGSPDRMDADLNGIPCETVYPAEEIDAYLGG